MAWMNDPFSASPEGGKWRQKLLGFDAWLDSSLHEAGQGFGEYYERLRNFMRRFKAEGFWRAFWELASEGTSLGIVGAMVLLVFAVPAFDAVNKDWRTQADFARSSKETPLSLPSPVAGQRYEKAR